MIFFNSKIVWLLKVWGKLWTRWVDRLGLWRPIIENQTFYGDVTTFSMHKHFAFFTIVCNLCNLTFSFITPASFSSKYGLPLLPSSQNFLLFHECNKMVIRLLSWFHFWRQCQSPCTHWQDSMLNTLENGGRIGLVHMTLHKQHMDSTSANQARFYLMTRMFKTEWQFSSVASAYSLWHYSHRMAEK